MEAIGINSQECDPRGPKRTMKQQSVPCVIDTSRTEIRTWNDSRNIQNTPGLPGVGNDVAGPTVLFAAPVITQLVDLRSSR